LGYFKTPLKIPETDRINQSIGLASDAETRLRARVPEDGIDLGFDSRLGMTFLHLLDCVTPQLTERAEQ
jgi:hypothetical protein